MKISMLMLNIFFSCINFTMQEMLINFENMTMGHYDVLLNESKLCAGPKSANITRIEIRDEKRGYNGKIYANYTFVASVKIDYLKVIVYRIDENNVSMSVGGYHSNEPCKNFFFRPLSSAFLDPHQNCRPPKGFTISKHFDVDRITRMIMGPLFPYGRYLSKFIILSKKSNVLCLILDLSFVPQKQKDADAMDKSKA